MNTSKRCTQTKYGGGDTEWLMIIMPLIFTINAYAFDLIVLRQKVTEALTPESLKNQLEYIFPYGHLSWTKELQQLQNSTLYNSDADTLSLRLQHTFILDKVFSRGKYK